MKREIAKLIDRYVYIESRSLWIPVSERLPEIPEGQKEVECLVGDIRYGSKDIGYYKGLWCDSPEFQDIDGNHISVTHWQYLPELPKEA